MIKLNITADNINDENKSLKDGFEELYGPDVSQVDVDQQQKVSITRKMMCSTPKVKGFFIFNLIFYNRQKFCGEIFD